MAGRQAGGLHNAAMSDPASALEASQLTPAGQLEEGDLLRLVGYQLAQAQIVTDAVFAAEVGRGLDLRQIEFTVLALVARNPGLTASELANALAVTPPYIASCLDKLLRRGLIERLQSPLDRRAMHIHVTAAGGDMVRSATQRLLARERQSLDALSTAERLMLAELLHKAASCRRPG